jgi:hypothetical protein
MHPQARRRRPRDLRTGALLAIIGAGLFFAGLFTFVSQWIWQ